MILSPVTVEAYWEEMDKIAAAAGIAARARNLAGEVAHRTGIKKRDYGVVTPDVMKKFEGIVAKRKADDAQKAVRKVSYRRAREGGMSPKQIKTVGGPGEAAFRVHAGGRVGKTGYGGKTKVSQALLKYAAMKGMFKLPKPKLPPPPKPPTPKFNKSPTKANTGVFNPFGAGSSTPGSVSSVAK